jgi:glycosyltransferase involved in cell wall biosynthesis
MSSCAPPPTVSIVIPTYEASRSLIDAINSVLIQKGSTKDIIVIEDGSDQPSLSLLEDNFAALLGEPEKHTGIGSGISSRETQAPIMRDSIA